ncbi:MAG: WD40/YVTN/BNR-like repeat-containing protein [Polyangia bacterium]
MPRSNQAWAALACLGLGFGLAATARADGAFPNSQNIMTPAALPHEIVLGTNFGLVISVDDGHTWTWSCEQPLNAFATLYQVGAPPANRLYANSDQGVIASDDLGCSWSAATGLAPGVAPLDVFADPTDASRVFAVAPASADAGAIQEVRRSTDGGRSFDAVVYSAAAGDHVTGVEVARSAPQTLTVTLTSGTAFTPKVAQSTDGGGHWTLHDLSGSLPSKTYSISLIAVDPTNPQKLFLRAGSAAGEVVAVSTDGGATATTPVSLARGALTAFTRLDSGTLLAAGVEGSDNVAYRSKDGGATFQKLPTALPVLALSARGTTVYAATDTSITPAAIQTSADEGTTWQPLMAYSDIQAIQTCVMAMCQDDCLSRADMQQWSDAICSAAAPISGGGGGGGRASGGTAGHASTGSGGGAGSPSGGGSGCDVGAGRWSWLALGGILGLLGAGWARRRQTPTN